MPGVGNWVWDKTTLARVVSEDLREEKQVALDCVTGVEGVRVTVSVPDQDSLAAEARLLGLLKAADPLLSLRHKHVRQVYECHVEKTSLTLLCEGLGKRLAGVVSSYGKLSEELTRKILLQVINGLEALAQLNIVLRVTMSNIHLNSDGIAKIRVCLIDAENKGTTMKCCVQSLGRLAGAICDQSDMVVSFEELAQSADKLQTLRDFLQYYTSQKPCRGLPGQSNIHAGLRVEKRAASTSPGEDAGSSKKRNVKRVRLAMPLGFSEELYEEMRQAFYDRTVPSRQKVDVVDFTALESSDATSSEGHDLPPQAEDCDMGEAEQNGGPPQSQMEDVCEGRSGDDIQFDIAGNNEDASQQKSSGNLEVQVEGEPASEPTSKSQARGDTQGTMLCPEEVLAGSPSTFFDSIPEKLDGETDQGSKSEQKVSTVSPSARNMSPETSGKEPAIQETRGGRIKRRAAIEGDLRRRQNLRECNIKILEKPPVDVPRVMIPESILKECHKPEDKVWIQSSCYDFEYKKRLMPTIADIPCDPAHFSRGDFRRVLKDGAQYSVFAGTYGINEFKGRGVIALENIFKNKCVFEYTGNLLSEIESSGTSSGEQYFFEIKENQEDEDNRHMATFRLPNGHIPSIIDATNVGNASRFLNHSCCPNLEVLKEDDKVKRIFMEGGIFHIVFKAIRDIQMGEELTIDYHPALTEQNLADCDPGQRVPCHCGSGSKCKKWIILSGGPDDEDEGQMGGHS